jgi:acetyl-CoA decarbonylase/synthase complex subunit delta
MAVEFLRERWTNSITEVKIGATEQEGGTRSTVIRVGGASTLPYLFEEGNMPNPPIIAHEIWDIDPPDWPRTLREPFADVLDKPVEWAKRCVNEFNAQIICLRLQGAHPDFGNNPVEREAELTKEILRVIDKPLIILGCADIEKDNLVLPKCAEVSRGERCLIGDAIQDNYKTLVASCLADGHNIIAESPIDINIAKQLNILITDMGLPPERVVINPTIGALGYGLEYAYSIMERGRLAALSGDKMLSMPYICFVGHEAWRAKEAKALKTEFPEWGPEELRGPIWETITATALLQAGADILIMRHPKAIQEVEKTIAELMRR